jgi:hypothetical protein
MMKSIIGLLLAIVTLSAGASTPVLALTALRVQPTSYKTELKQGEKKLGFVDVSNPTKETLKLTTSVSAFRQVADDGTLEFYRSGEVQAGIIPDLTEFELKPLEAMRVYFMLDGTKLPSGDVFGALFFTAKPASAAMAITQTVRLGVLFSIVNGTPGPREAEVVSLKTSFIQFGKAITGTFGVRNRASEGQATGFYPKVRVAVAPFGGSKLIDSPLVFAGRTRTVSFNIPANRFGFYRLNVETGSSQKSHWIFAMTGWGRSIPPFIFVVLVAALIWRHFRHSKK